MRDRFWHGKLYWFLPRVFENFDLVLGSAPAPQQCSPEFEFRDHSACLAFNHFDNVFRIFQRLPKRGSGARDKWGGRENVCMVVNSESAFDKEGEPAK